MWMKILRRRVEGLKQRFEMSRYDNFTIAEYFREQGARIGEGCYFAIRHLGTEPFLLNIGNHVCVAEGVEFHTHDGGTWIFREEIPDLRVYGPIRIEDNCMIGTRAQIFAGVRIGGNSVVGAGSVVLTDIPPNSIAVGVPARVFGSVEKYKQKCMEKWRVQKPPDFRFDGVQHYEMLDDPRAVVQEMRAHLMKVFEDELR
jgi:acetyltransferase-like isoleucine patch superfamily enzyme